LSGPSQTSSSDAARLDPKPDDPGGARERTSLAWTRSALNMAASGTLIARAAFAAHLVALGIASAVAMGAMALFTWDHGRAIYRDRGLAGGFPHHQPGALELLTAATLVIAFIAVVVTIAI
jgi:uncharacterized membrane protein YidH (DUF202 family)